MKLIITLLILCFYSSFQTFGQCNYEKIEYDKSKEEATLKLAPITLDLFETPINGRIVLASLIRTDNQYFIEIEITKDSKSKKLEPICFEKGARLSFSLKNNAVVSIIQREEKICGITYYDEKNNYSTVSNYARFTLTQPAFDKLVQSEAILMKISAESYEDTFVLKNELEEQFDDKTIVSNPTRFFMDNIECLTNPKLK